MCSASRRNYSILNVLAYIGFHFSISSEMPIFCFSTVLRLNRKIMCLCIRNSRNSENVMSMFSHKQVLFIVMKSHTSGQTAIRSKKLMIAECGRFCGETMKVIVEIKLPSLRRILTGNHDALEETMFLMSTYSHAQKNSLLWLRCAVVEANTRDSV